MFKKQLNIVIKLLKGVTERNRAGGGIHFEEEKSELETYRFWGRLWTCAGDCFWFSNEQSSCRYRDWLINWYSHEFSQ